MSLDRHLAELAELRIEGGLSAARTDELLDMLRRTPKATGLLRDLLATDYHLREAHHTEAHQKSLEESVTEQLRAVATADDFVDSTLERIQELGERWGAEEKMKRRPIRSILRAIAAPFSAAARLRPRS